MHGGPGSKVVYLFRGEHMERLTQHRQIEVFEALLGDLRKAKFSWPVSLVAGICSFLKTLLGEVWRTLRVEALS